MDNQLVNEQALLFFECLRVGIVMGIVYDLLRISRKLIKHLDIFVHIEDLLYWVGCSILAFSMVYMHNYANIRIFAFIGIILGAVFYFITFSVLFMKVATKVIEWLQVAIKYIFNLVMVPIKWTISMLLIPLGFLWILLGKLNVKRQSKMRQVKRQLVLKNADLKTEMHIHKTRKSFQEENALQTKNK